MGLVVPLLPGAVAQSSYETPLDLQRDSFFYINVYSDAFKTDDQRLTLFLDTGSADMSVPAHCVQDDVEVVQAGVKDVWGNTCDFVKAKVWVLDFDDKPHAVDEYSFYSCYMAEDHPCDQPLSDRHSGIVGGKPGYMRHQKSLTLVSALAMAFGANYGHGIKAWRTGDDVQWSQLAASLFIGDPYDNMIWRDDASSKNSNFGSWNGKACPGLSLTLYNPDGSPFAWHEGPAYIDTGAPELQFVDEDLFNDESRTVPCPAGWAMGEADRHCVWDATVDFTFTGSDGTQLQWSVDLQEVSNPVQRFSEGIVCRGTSQSGCWFAAYPAPDPPNLYHPGNSIWFNVQMVYWDAAMERVGIAPLGDQARRLWGGSIHV